MVHSRIILLTVSLIFAGSTAFSQRMLWGRISDDLTGLVLESVTVWNITADKTNTTDQGGNFKISAKPGDTLIFSLISYSSDTLIIGDNPSATLGQIKLKPKPEYLAAITKFDDDYSKDSLERRNYYRKFTDSTSFAKVVNDSSVAPGGFGITLSPLSFISKSQKDSRKFKKKLAMDEKQAYIDSRFPRGYVARVTGLKGDSLQTFYIKYRPSYDFCRKSNKEDILLYINKQLIAFKKGDKKVKGDKKLGKT